MHAPSCRDAAGRTGCRLAILALGLATVLAMDTWAAPPAKRARPPKFSKSISDVFFPDARQKLVGPRPDQPAADRPPDAAATTPGGRAAAPVGGTQSGWPQSIAAEVIEDEIKTQQRKLGDTLQNAARFKGGDYRLARNALSLLAALFAIDAEFGEPMRWQREAPAVRDLVARAGFNCKVGTDASYQEAKARFEDLESLVRGGTVQAPPGAPAAKFNEVSDRGPLMKRLELAHQQRLAPWTSSADEFSRNVDRLSHEAQLVAALATAIQREGYEFADDETYRQYAEAMRTQAVAVRDAAKSKNYAEARQAVGEIGKACAACHEGYRN